MTPIIKSAQLVEGDVTDVGPSFIIIGDRDIPRNAIVWRLDSICELPMASSIGGISDMSVVLKSSNNLLRIPGIHSDRRFGEEARFGCHIADFRFWRFWKPLGRRTVTDQDRNRAEHPKSQDHLLHREPAGDASRSSWISKLPGGVTPRRFRTK